MHLLESITGDHVMSISICAIGFQVKHICDSFHCVLQKTITNYRIVKYEEN